MDVSFKLIFNHILANQFLTKLRYYTLLINDSPLKGKFRVLRGKVFIGKKIRILLFHGTGMDEQLMKNAIFRSTDRNPINALADFLSSCFRRGSGYTVDITIASVSIVIFSVVTMDSIQFIYVLSLSGACGQRRECLKLHIQALAIKGSTYKCSKSI